jgi:hypothetical protein
MHTHSNDKLDRETRCITGVPSEGWLIKVVFAIGYRQRSVSLIDQRPIG